MPAERDPYAMPHRMADFSERAVVNLAKFDLNLLRTLDALLRERSVTRAADGLRVTQQAVSNSLKRLREHFEDPLLVRAGRGMELTPLARTLDRPLREALVELETLLQRRLDFNPATTARAFRLALPHYAAFFLMPQVLRRLALEAPLIALDAGATGSRPLAALERGEFDLLIMDESTGLNEAEPARESIRSKLLLSDRFVCVADHDHPELKQGLTTDLYLKIPHCLTRFTPESRSIVERAWARLGLRPYVAAAAPGFVVSLFTVPGTGLIATVPQKLAALHAKSLGLHVHDCPIPIGPIEEHLFWQERNNDDLAHAYVRSLFLTASTALSSDR